MQFRENPRFLSPSEVGLTRPAAALQTQDRGWKALGAGANSGIQQLTQVHAPLGLGAAHARAQRAAQALHHPTTAPDGAGEIQRILITAATAFDDVAPGFAPNDKARLVADDAVKISRQQRDASPSL